MGSGQTFGSIEVITPFRDNRGGHVNDDDCAFFQPELHVGEAMTTLDVHGGDMLYIGTSYGRVLQYQMAAGASTMHRGKERPGVAQDGAGAASYPGPRARRSGGGGAAAQAPLDLPPFVPAPPAASIDPAALLHSSSSSGHRHPGPAQEVFSGYVLASPPLLSSEGGAPLHPRYSRARVRGTTLGPMASRALLPPSKRCLSKRLLENMGETAPTSSTVSSSGAGENPSADFVKVFLTTSLELNDLLKDAGDVAVEDPSQSDYRGKKKGVDKNDHKAPTTKKALPNPNKCLYSAASFTACYDATADQRRKKRDSNRPTEQQHLGEEELISNEESGTPRRYRLMIRPPFYKVSNFDYTAYNNTGLWVGWDYPSSFANSFACSVLALLYFVEEIREVALRLQLGECEGMPWSKKQMQQQQIGNGGGHETSKSVFKKAVLLLHPYPMFNLMLNQ